MHNVAIVTGGAGFIGSHLCKRLLDEGYYVVSIDNYFTGTRENHHDHKNILYVNNHAKSINNLFLSSDIKLNDGSVISLKNVKYVFHLGEYSRVETSFNDLEMVFGYNNSLPAICEFCRKYGSKLIYSGSSTKFAEEGIISPYALSKAQNTEFVNHYAQWYDIDYAITYFYNVYGPGEISDGEYATVVAKFLNKTKNGEPLVVTSPGTQKRNFTHVYDIVDGLMLVAEHGHGDEYGIGNDKAFSILDLASMISDDLLMGSHKPGNRLSARVCNERLKELGWKCKHDLRDYIQERLND